MQFMSSTLKTERARVSNGYIKCDCIPTPKLIIFIFAAGHIYLVISLASQIQYLQNFLIIPPTPYLILLFSIFLLSIVITIQVFDASSLKSVMTTQFCLSHKKLFCASINNFSIQQIFNFFFLFSSFLRISVLILPSRSQRF